MGTRPIIDLRLRLESVDAVALPEDAHAVTLRGRVGAETGEVWGFKLLAEAELVWPLVDNYNDTLNGKTQYPVVSDPETSEVNRLQLSRTRHFRKRRWCWAEAARIVYDDQRFVGNVGWRQNQQTFDALRVTNTSLRGLTLDLAYLWQVDRVVAAIAPSGRYTGDSFLGNLSYALPVGKVTGFVYLLDFEEATTDSSSTVGVRYSVEKPVGPVRLVGLASYAEQHDRAANPLDYSERYWAAELWARCGAGRPPAASRCSAVTAPRGLPRRCATLHRFQGWADKFFSTPVDGIDDRYLSLGYSRKPAGIIDSVSVSVAYHRFEAGSNLARLRVGNGHPVAGAVARRQRGAEIRRLSRRRLCDRHAEILGPGRIRVLRLRHQDRKFPATMPAAPADQADRLDSKGLEQGIEHPLESPPHNSGAAAAGGHFLIEVPPRPPPNRSLNNASCHADRTRRSHSASSGSRDWR